MAFSNIMCDRWISSATSITIWEFVAEAILKECG